VIDVVTSLVDEGEEIIDALNFLSRLGAPV
jgi:hypothetical protein